MSTPPPPSPPSLEIRTGAVIIPVASCQVVLESLRRLNSARLGPNVVTSYNSAVGDGGGGSTGGGGGSSKGGQGGRRVAIHLSHDAALSLLAGESSQRPSGVVAAHRRAVLGDVVAAGLSSGVFTYEAGLRPFSSACRKQATTDMIAQWHARKAEAVGSGSGSGSGGGSGCGGGDVGVDVGRVGGVGMGEGGGRGGETKCAGGGIEEGTVLAAAAVGAAAGTSVPGEGCVVTQQGDRPPPRTSFTFVELFAGIGGFRLGLAPLGGTCVFASELDALARALYATNFDGEECAGDITAVDAADIPCHDILTAGFPCQPFAFCNVANDDSRHAGPGINEVSVGGVYGGGDGDKV